MQVRVDAGTANLHDMDDARNQSKRTLSRLAKRGLRAPESKIGLLRAKGAEGWVRNS